MHHSRSFFPHIVLIIFFLAIVALCSIIFYAQARLAQNFTPALADTSQISDQQLSQYSQLFDLSSQHAKARHTQWQQLANEIK